MASTSTPVVWTSSNKERVFLQVYHQRMWIRWSEMERVIQELTGTFNRHISGKDVNNEKL
jgi:hypothetical protein